MGDFAKSVCDVTGICLIASYFAGWLPAVATALAILWYCVEIYESKTFRRLFQKPKE